MSEIKPLLKKLHRAVEVREAMEAEHTKAADSHDEFTTGNYGVTTTAVIEWQFVADPEREGLMWPVEEKLRDAAPDKMRKPLPLAELQRKREAINQQLQAMNEPEMLEDECFGARLYSGPMCAASRQRSACDSTCGRVLEREARLSPIVGGQTLVRGTI